MNDMFDTVVFFAEGRSPHVTRASTSDAVAPAARWSHRVAVAIGRLRHSLVSTRLSPWIFLAVVLIHVALAVPSGETNGWARRHPFWIIVGTVALIVSSAVLICWSLDAARTHWSRLASRWERTPPDPTASPLFDQDLDGGPR